jgi:3-mercaptopyruvate sulfurtransferase SseA
MLKRSIFLFQNCKNLVYQKVKFDLKMFSSVASNKNNLIQWNFEQVKEFAEKSPEMLKYENPRTFLIDVRTQDEINKTGLIPNSKHVQLNELETFLKEKKITDSHETSFNSKEDILIFSCLKGMRALQAAKLAQENFEIANSGYYSGSWEEWSSKQ